jgi:hypothetical protein
LNKLLFEKASSTVVTAKAVAVAAVHAKCESRDTSTWAAKVKAQA